MRTAAISIAVTISVLLVSGQVGSETWQELLDRADSLAAAGNLDSANVVVDDVISRALTEHDRSDTTVEIRFYREGISRGYYFRSFEEAEQLYSHVLSLKEMLAGDRHPSLIEILLDLSDISIVLMEYSRARDLCERSVAISEMALGPMHPQTGRSLRHLANTHLYLGDYEEAEVFHKHGLSVLQGALRPDHPDLACSQYDLAYVYHFQGKYAEAESLHIQALDIREASLGAYHPDVARSLDGLASLCGTRGEYGRAEPLFSRALEISERSLGVNHPDVASILNGLAGIHSDQGEYDEAEALYKRSLAIMESVLGPDHIDVASSLNNLAILHRKQGRYAEAESLYMRALAINEKVLGPDHLDVAAILGNLASVYGSLGKNSEAEPLLLRSLDITEKATGPDHPDLAHSYYSLAIFYLRESRYDEAEPLLRRALDIWEKTLGPAHPFLATCLSSLAGLCHERGRPDEALAFWERSLAVEKDLFGPDHPQLVDNLFGLGNFYVATGQYAEAEAPVRRALVISQKAYGRDHSLVGTCLQNLGGLYWRLSRYAEADSLFNEALAIQERALGPDSPGFAASLNGLGAVCLDQGRYAEAEALCVRALEIWEACPELDHYQTGATLGNVGGLYVAQGRYEEAELLLRRAVSYEEKALGPDDPILAATLHNLALTIEIRGKHAEAESLYLRALSIEESTLGPTHPRLAVTLFNIGSVYARHGSHASAESMFMRGLDIIEASLGRLHPEFAVGLSCMARVYADQGKAAAAESLYLEALGVREASLGPDHPHVAGTLSGMCHLRRLQGRGTEALELAETASDIRQRSFAENSFVLSEKDALKFSRLLRRSVDEYLTCLFDLPSLDSESRLKAVGRVLATKGAVSDNMFERQMALVEEQDTTVLELAESLRLTKLQISDLFVGGPGEDLGSYWSKLDSLGTVANELEVQLWTQSSSYRERQDIRNISASRIMTCLPENSALIEFARYQYQGLESEKKTPRYLATVLAKNTSPMILDLGEASEIDDLVETYRSHMQQLASSGRMPTVVESDAYRRIAGGLYSKIWGPVEGRLDDKSLVLISPDGSLNMLSFGGLIDSDGAYLVEKYQIHYISSGRDAIRLIYKTESGSGLFALGDPDYGATVASRSPRPAVPEEEAVEITCYITRNIRSSAGGLEDVTVSPLPGTRQEVDLIASEWSEFTVEPITVYFGPDASEENLKAKAPGSRVIHLATHGYFMQGPSQSDIGEFGPEDDVGFVGENPLLLSGLFLAGANLHGEGADRLGAEDGVLTAYEVSAMDLAGTELVVLSACETGLGKVEEGEGVYGLRRAFQMAGARTVISALWPVSDEVTADMLSQLYERQDESVPETMRRVQLDKINEFRRNGQSDHPFTWAGFIALGDWE